MSRITKIRQNNSQDDYNIGTTFDHVVYDYQENGTIKRFTLTELYTYLKNFFNNGSFIMYSNSKPKNTKVKVWYDTTVTSE